MDDPYTINLRRSSNSETVISDGKRKRNRKPTPATAISSLLNTQLISSVMGEEIVDAVVDPIPEMEIESHNSFIPTSNTLNTQTMNAGYNQVKTQPTSDTLNTQTINPCAFNQIKTQPTSETLTTQTINACAYSPNKTQAQCVAPHQYTHYIPSPCTPQPQCLSQHCVAHHNAVHHCTPQQHHQFTPQTSFASPSTGTTQQTQPSNPNAITISIIPPSNDSTGSKATQISIIPPASQDPSYNQTPQVSVVQPSVVQPPACSHNHMPHQEEQILIPHSSCTPSQFVSADRPIKSEHVFPQVQSCTETEIATGSICNSLNNKTSSAYCVEKQPIVTYQSEFDSQPPVISNSQPLIVTAQPVDSCTQPVSSNQQQLSTVQSVNNVQSISKTRIVNISKPLNNTSAVIATKQSEKTTQQSTCSTHKQDNTKQPLHSTEVLVTKKQSFVSNKQTLIGNNPEIIKTKEPETLYILMPDNTLRLLEQ